MAYHEHFTRVDTRLHRATVCGRDTCNGTCEQACGCLCCPTAGDLDIHPHHWDKDSQNQPKPERMRVAKFYRVCAVVVLAIFSALLLVHFGVSK